VTHKVLKERPAMNYRLDKNPNNQHNPAKQNVQQDHQDPKENWVHLEILEISEKEVHQVELVHQENLETKAVLECQAKLEDLVYRVHLV